MMESINAPWGIAIVRAERSRSSSMPFGLSRAGKTIPRVNTLQEVSGLSPDLIATQSSTQNPAVAKSSLAHEFLT